MTLYDFNILNENEQYNVLQEHGVLVGDRNDDLYRYILYQVELYIEAQLSAAEENIISIRSFISDVPLQAYLEQIDLKELS